MANQKQGPEIAVIGGTGFESLPCFSVSERHDLRTPYGRPSSELVEGTLGKAPLVFLSRHGRDHTIPPHLVNYRANIHALKSRGVNRIIAFGAVGGIGCKPGSIVIPDQLIDYTWGREHTYYDGKKLGDQGTDLPVVDSVLEHVEFSCPFDSELRNQVISAAARAQVQAIGHGTYAVTQGPRLETAAEIDRIERDGADIVGMTGMPEAGLARELGISYVNISMVVNEAAGRGNKPICMDDITQVLSGTTSLAIKILQTYCELSMGQTPTIAPNRG